MGRKPRNPLILNKEVLLVTGFKSRADLWKTWERLWGGGAPVTSASKLKWEFCDARSFVRQCWIPCAKMRKKR